MTRSDNGRSPVIARHEAIQGGNQKESHTIDFKSHP